MKVAVYSSQFPILSQTFVISQIVGLKKQGVEVDILCLKKSESGLLHSDVSKYNLMDNVIELAPFLSKGKFSRILSFMKNTITQVFSRNVVMVLKTLFNRNLKINQKETIIGYLSLGYDKLSYDNIICHFGNHGYLLSFMKEIGLLDSKVSTVFHGYELSQHKVVESYKSQYQELFKIGDLMLPVCDLYKEKLISLGCKENKIIVHRMGIDTAKFNLTERKRDLNNEVRLLQVGRLTYKKAILDTISSVIKANETISVSLNIVGDGELMNEAELLIKDNNADSYIKLLGLKSQEDVKLLMEQSDVFILPSITPQSGDTESIPVCLMEASATGLIVISTFHSAIPELVEDGVSGMLVPESDVDALCDKIVSVSRMEKTEIARMINNARMKVVERHDNNTLNSVLCKLLKDG